MVNCALHLACFHLGTLHTLFPAAFNDADEAFGGSRMAPAAMTGLRLFYLQRISVIMAARGSESAHKGGRPIANAILSKLRMSPLRDNSLEIRWTWRRHG
jgi:hypothetical protein